MVGGTDLIFTVARSVDVQATVLAHFSNVWPRLVVEEVAPFDHGKDLFIFRDQTAKELVDREGCVPGNHYIELMFAPYGQIVTHEIQQVTIVVPEFDEAMFDIVSKIQYDFLRGFLPKSTKARNPHFTPRPGDLFQTPEGDYVLVDIQTALMTSFWSENEKLMGSFDYLDGWTKFAKDFEVVETAEQTQWPWPMPPAMRLQYFMDTMYPTTAELRAYIQTRLQAVKERTPTGEVSPSSTE